MAFTPKSLITESQYWPVEMILLVEYLLHKREVLTLEIWDLQKDPRSQQSPPLTQGLVKQRQEDT